MPDWLAAILPLAGVVLGYAGASRQETTRWRRDWLGSVLKTRTEQYASPIEAMDSEYIVLSRAAGGDPVGQERFDVSAEAWRSQRARSRIFAGPRAQDAAEQLDRARESVILAINEKSPTANAAAAQLVDARMAMIDAVDDDLMDMNRAVIRWFMSPWQRMRQRRALANLSV
jgi:hypothetical protein